MKSILLVVILISTGLSANAKEIKMASGDWCPYVCDPTLHKGKMGYLPDIVKIIFEKEGYTFKMHYLPFARVVDATKRGDYVAIPGVYKSDVPDFIFASTPQGLGGNEIYVLKENSWKYKGLSSLKDLKGKIGITNDYTYGKKIDKFIKTNSEIFNTLSGEDPQGRNMKMLATKRVVAWIEDVQVAKFNISKEGLTTKILSAGQVGEELPVYVGFSPKNAEESKKYAKLVEDGIKELRKSGKLKEILSDYGLSDW